MPCHGAPVVIIAGFLPICLPNRGNRLQKSGLSQILCVK